MGIKKNATIALSSTKAKYVAVALATEEGIWLKAILEEINLRSTTTGDKL